MRAFYLDRRQDHTGVSGIGVVAEGVEFDDKTVVLRWRGPRPTTVMHDSIENVMAIHCHGGTTELVFLSVQDTPSNDTPNGTKCSVCGRPQTRCPSGLHCENGHGGAPSLEPGQDPDEGWADIEDSIEWGTGTEGMDATLAEVLSEGNH